MRKSSVRKTAGDTVRVQRPLFKGLDPAPRHARELSVEITKNGNKGAWYNGKVGLIVRVLMPLLSRSHPGHCTTYTVYEGPDDGKAGRVIHTINKEDCVVI